jgi:hypothetical protein
MPDHGFIDGVVFVPINVPCRGDGYPVDFGVSIKHLAWKPA